MTKYFKDLTTFKIGGPIKYFREVKNESQIRETSDFARKNGLKIFILGAGSDILVSDADFDGVVIKYTGNSVQRTGDRVTAEAGVKWDDLVKLAVENNLQGLECLSGIPGTVGAAPIQNIGAYGQEVKGTLLKLRAFDFSKNKFVEFTNSDCQFGYRESIFKKKQNYQRFLISAVTFKLNQDKEPCVEYESLRNHLAAEGKGYPSLQDVREAIVALRRQRLEDPRKVPNAGSFFKNPIVSTVKADKLKKKYPDMPFFVQGSNKIKLFAAWLVEKAGWKGETLGGVAVSDKNALILINKSGKAKARDVAGLSGKIIKDVKKKFGIVLEPEVQFINFPSKVAVLGYGLEGQDAEKYFKNTGAEVTILDQKFDKNYLRNLDRFDVIVRSPGVYRYLPQIVKAEKDGVKITSAIRIFFAQCPAKIIGVTGTKGKGTTATLIDEILKKAGKDVYLAGNIGKPYLELLPLIHNSSFVILEMSSFQLIDMDQSPHIAVILNITSDHLDWHKNRKEYVEAKKNIVAHQAAADFAVINVEYATPKSFARETKAKVIFFDKEELKPKFKQKLLLRGEHNLENVAAAVGVAKILKIKDTVILEAIRNFKGLEHRLELVRQVNGVTFYNDSFATGPQPTAAAIRAFTEAETLILGGSDKGLDYAQLRSEIEKRENVKNLILIGQIGEKIGKGIKNKKVISLGKTAMPGIVKEAYKVTPKGGVVILSPAAASFDMFANYKDRGNQFKKAVRSLK